MTPLSAPTFGSFSGLGALHLQMVAQWCDGQGTAPDDPRLLAWMLPADTREWVRDYLTTRTHGGGLVSTCAVVTLSSWAHLGVDHPALCRPYAQQIGMAVALVQQIARAFDAWEQATEDVSPGDVVLVTGPEHVMTVESADADGLTVVQGGGPGVHRSAPRWSTIAGGKLALGGRAVLGVCRTDLLRAA